MSAKCIVQATAPAPSAAQRGGDARRALPAASPPKATLNHFGGTAPAALMTSMQKRPTSAPESDAASAGEGGAHDAQGSTAAAAPAASERRAVKPEPIDRDVMDRSFLHSVSVGLPEMS